ncbi:hypothetical protein SDC9_45449 [bioreactor metagenome]|uniref:Uncharacterized protein n=1 Tax=bioreactor metagenome TaxID=1076179 RepID=A0A644W9K0_9ZZZZ
MPPPGGENSLCGPDADSWNAEYFFVGCPVHVHREEVRMAQGPARLGVEGHVEVGLFRGQDFFGPEAVEPEEPVRLVEPVFPEHGRLRGAGRKEGVIRHGDVGGVIDPLEPEAPVESFGQAQNGKVVLRGGPHHELGALSRGNEGRSGPAGTPPFFSFLDGSADEGHGAEDGVPALLGGEGPEACLGRQLDIHAHPVGEEPESAEKGRRGAGDGLGVNVASETVLLPEDCRRPDELYHGVVRRTDDGGAEKEPFDIVSPVHLDGQVREFPGSEGGPRDVGAPPVHAVGAVENAVVGEQDLEQGDAPSVVGPAMADAAEGGAAHGAPPSGASAGRAGHVVFRSFGEHRELSQSLHDNLRPLCDNEMLASRGRKEKRA